MHIHDLKNWFAKATRAQRLALANRASTSVAYIYQLATGRRRMTAEQAASIEQASHVIHRNNGGLTEKLDRRRLCLTCRRCPHAK